MPVQTQPNQSVPQERRGRTLGERVALRLEMAAYFRRNDMNSVNGSAADGNFRNGRRKLGTANAPKASNLHICQKGHMEPR